MKLIIFSIIIPFLLSGCDNSRNLAEMCKNNQDICTEFGQDSWCKKERIQVAFSRIDLKNTQQDVHRFNLLTAYEGYIKCMALASQIQHIKLKEKTTLRKNNLFKARASLEKLSQETLSSKHPHLLFYHWTRSGNQESLAEFLQMEGSAALENTTAQYHLATHYVKRDINKTLNLLYHALELYEPGTVLNPEIFQTLATIYTNKEQYQQSYIWLKVYYLELTSNKEKKQIEVMLEQYKSVYELDRDFLDDVAESTLDKIYEGSFTSPKH